MDHVRSADGTQVAFDRSGDGPPLILIGGALSDRRAAAPLASLLAERFTVVAYDRRGRGDSGDTPPYAVEREVEDVHALLDRVGGAGALYGHSSGAVLALEVAAAGARVTRLVLYEPPFVVDDTRPPLPEDYVERLEALVAAGRRDEALEHFLTAGVGLPEEAVAGMRSAPMWSGMEALAHTLAYDGRVMGPTMFGRPLPAERWASVRVPTLVLDGGASPSWQRNAAAALAAVLPDARARTLEGQDHGPAIEVLAPVLIGFLD